jgi:growth factor-regulated tyrosine kinase substrate
MLEERLSNTYSQHTISGYNIPGQRHTSNIYPSIASNVPSGSGGVESFYTGPIQQEHHGRPQSTYSYGTPQQYSNYENRASMAAPAYVAPDQRNIIQNQMPSQPHRSGSYSMSSPYPQQFSAPAPEPQEPAYGPTPSQQPPNFAPSEPVMTPSADANASFYYGNAPQKLQAAPHQGLQEQIQTPYPNIQSPPQHHQLLHPVQSPQQFTHQPPQGVSSQPLPQFNQPQQAPPQQTYWQSQPQHSMPPQNWQQAPPPQQINYTQDSFPMAPQHAPQPQPVPVEESLIEL